MPARSGSWPCPGVLLLGCRSDEQAIAEHLQRGEDYQNDKKYAEAVIEYKNVLQIDPNHADAHYGLAKSHLQLGQAKEGFWELRETVRLDPKNYDAGGPVRARSRSTQASSRRR